MLSRFIAKSIRHSRFLSFPCSPHSSLSPSPLFSSSQSRNFTPTLLSFRHFSTDNGDNRSNDPNGKQPTSELWKLSSESENSDAFFGKDDDGDLKREEAPWVLESGGNGLGERENGNGGGGSEVDEGWQMAAGYKPWTLGEEEKVEGVFDIGDVEGGEREKESVVGDDVEEIELKKSQEDKDLEKEEERLTAVLKGPNRAFGDLVAASGITDSMLDSLIALKNFQDVEGLPPLTEIEDLRYERSMQKSARAEMERQKQEEVAKARVRQVDEKGRAYGTGKRKCSIARVWIQPGEGKFLVNDKEFDVYFPMLDHRAALLRPFAETKTLGLWDVKCTVKGGGISGQVGAIRLGVSRALQNWEPGLRPPLRQGGFLTRDSRVVERKKPGKAKARKSFQWVKR